MFDNFTMPIDFKTLITKIVDQTIKTHKKNRKIHAVLHSLASSDEAVNAEFINLEDQITIKIAQKLDEFNLQIENVLEKVHYAMDVIQTFSHEYVFDKHEYIDYIVMRDIVTKTLTDLFTK